VSVIVPNRDMGRYLDDAFRSIERQGEEVDQVILVDTGSRDDSLSIAERWQSRGLPLEILSAPDANPARARNAGLERARAPLIGFLDADDVLPDRKLRQQRERLEREPRVDAVSGWATLFEELDAETLAPAAGSRTDRMTGVMPGAWLLRRAVLERIGTFDESLRYSEDTDLVMRMLEEGVGLTLLPRTVLYYRRHPDSLMSQPDPRKQKDFHRVLAMSIRRRARRGIRGDLPRLEDLVEEAGT
jgi:glycosyltransferase involved in cell wall biosynthesis